MNMETEETKHCIVCGNKIPLEAAVCQECHSFQSAWKNNLRYSASVIGILSVVLSAIVFIISTSPDVRKIVAWRDRVEVVGFNSIKPISVANLGDGEIFVTHIEISSELPSYNNSERIDRLIAPGSTVTVPRIDGVYSHLSDYDIPVSNDEKIRKALLERAVAPNKKACVVRVEAIPQDPGYLNYRKSKGEDMITYDVVANIHYYSIQKQEWKIQEISLIGYLWVDVNNDACWKK